MARKPIQPELTQPDASSIQHHGGGWSRSLIIGLCCLMRTFPMAGKLVPLTRYPPRCFPLAILRGDGFHLDRFRPLLRESNNGLPVFLTRSRGHIISRYPVATAVAALPLIAPQVWYRDARGAWLGPRSGPGLR